MNYPKLYSRDSKGKIRVWWVEINGNAYRQHYGVNEGKIVITGWSYAEVKNNGKANKTTPEEQAKLECDALVVKQLKSNYFKNIEDVDNGFLKPQLAKPCKEYIDKVKWSDGQIVDDKLNGICLLASKRQGVTSRKNEIFYAIPHIKEEIDQILEEFPNAFLHGELFNPEYVTQLNKLAEIVAVTRKEKDLTPELLAESERMARLYLYDGYGFAGIEQNDDNLVRRTLLNHFVIRRNFKYIKCVAWKIAFSLDEMVAYFDEYVSRGGEGVIIRNPKAPYVHKRTKDLLKYKKSESEEFKVLYFEEGEANWAGCAKAVWCELPNGVRDKKFKSNLRGSQEELREVLKNPEKYIGKMITVDFQEYSPFNTPLIPYSSLLIRDYE